LLQYVVVPKYENEICRSLILTFMYYYLLLFDEPNKKPSFERAFCVRIDILN